MSANVVANKIKQIMSYLKQRNSFMLRWSLILWITVFAIYILFFVLFETDDNISRNIYTSSIEEYIERRDAEIKSKKQSYIKNGFGYLDNSAINLPFESERYSSLSSYEVDENLDIDQLNTTDHAEIETLYFNRVPKVGSETFMELIKQLSVINGFSYHKDTPHLFAQIRLTEEEERNLAKMIIEFQPPSSYIEHTSFTNFTKYGYPKPVYINVVRDPIERVISWFYYARAAWKLVLRKKHFPDEPFPTVAWLKKDFETCVLTGDPECVFPQNGTGSNGGHPRQTLFFCGNDPECLPFNSKEAMERAIRSVEENYAVVSVLEDLDMSLTVLEHYVPRFFKGVRNIYKDIGSTKINSNSMKPPVSEHVKDMLRKNFTREIEFYEFCRNRLHKQYRAIEKQLDLEADQR